MDQSIIFIGPMGVGKSTVAKEIASRLQLEYVDVDEQRWAYFAMQPDYDGQLVEQLFDTSREIEAFRYMKPFEARYAVDVLVKHPFGVIDFGAGYTVYEDRELFAMVRSAFSKHRYVFFLRYCGDARESLEALRARHPDVPGELYDALNQDFIESPCNEILATHIIDTKDRTIQAIVDLVLEKVEKA